MDGCTVAYKIAVEGFELLKQLHLIVALILQGCFALFCSVQLRLRLINKPFHSLHYIPEQDSGSFLIAFVKV